MLQHIFDPTILRSYDIRGVYSGRSVREAADEAKCKCECICICVCVCVCICICNVYVYVYVYV